jgi:L-amino acid N-acyltransferase YncA
MNDQSGPLERGMAAQYASWQADPGSRDALAGSPRAGAVHGVLIRPMEPRDGAQVLAIYQAGLDTGQASFETAAPAWEEFDAARLRDHRYVAADAATGQLLGWTAAIAVSDRCVYAGVIEHSVYVHPGHHGRGIGAMLLAALIASADEAGVWTIQSGIFPENAASLRLHERAGFRAVGIRERIGRHHGLWRDVMLVERRSSTAGKG